MAGLPVNLGWPDQVARAETDQELGSVAGIGRHQSQAARAGLPVSGSSNQPAKPQTKAKVESTEYAQQQGKFLEFHHAAYKAYWGFRVRQLNSRPRLLGSCSSQT